MQKKLALMVSNVSNPAYCWVIEDRASNVCLQVHGANGYLVQQFLDNTSNHRTDRWGGSAENRSRFGLEVLKEIVAIWGADQVGVKLNPCGGYNDMG